MNMWILWMLLIACALLEVNATNCSDSSQCDATEACLRQTLQCVNPCDRSLEKCGYFAACYVVNHRAECLCPAGFTGDPLIHCFFQRSGLQKCTRNSKCEPHLACIDGKCADPCANRQCGQNAVCRAWNHFLWCECIRGYDGDPSVQCSAKDTDADYIHGEKDDSCALNCGPNAICHEQNGVETCQCLPEYRADPNKGCRPYYNSTISEASNDALEVKVKCDQAKAKISWKSPKENNAFIRRYKIGFKNALPEYQKTVDPSVHSANIPISMRNLDPGIKYKYLSTVENQLNDSTILMTNLVPETIYAFTVSAENDSNKTYKSGSNSCITQRAVPNKSGNNVKKSDGSIFKISWSPIGENGIFYVFWKPDYNYFNKFKQTFINEAKGLPYKFRDVFDIALVPSSATAFSLQINFNIWGDLLSEPRFRKSWIMQSNLTGLKPNTRYSFVITFVNRRNQQRVFIGNETTLVRPDKPMIELLSTNGYWVKVIWKKNKSGYLGDYFYAKYQMKGQNEWTSTEKVYDTETDFIIVKGLLAGAIYDFSVVSVGNGDENESDMATITIAKIDITKSDSKYVAENHKMMINCTRRNTNLEYVDAAMVIHWKWPSKVDDDRIKQVGPIIENFKVQANGGSCDMIYQLIVSKFDESKDYGEYECILENGPWTLDSATIKSDEVLNSRIINNGYFIAGLIALILILLIWPIVFTYRYYKLKKLLKSAGLTNFEYGNVDGLNPELALNMQADLLPYDRKYEFPRDKLKLGKELGAGAFGIVVEAKAQGILPHQQETNVAVKMVKNTANNEVMRALVSELKILIHLGQHLNVVNLLGAVTTDITKFNLMIIVEYCSYGNLHSFLGRNRQNFIDQIVPGTDEIHFDTNSMDKPIYSNINAEAGGSVVTVDESTSTASRSITTKDLFIWSFQIARGMAYLASRKVLHGDLAARNILLCDDNVVKICDFGLARTLCTNENYQMNSNRCLPVKWLAPEALNDFVFNPSTDVWSFGVVLWELFSLGATPYPNIEAKDLKFKLNDGLRMDKSKYATETIYTIMRSCWDCVPEKRPAFNRLEGDIAKILGKSDLEHYEDLSEPYLQANVCRCDGGNTDYFALLKSPDSQAPTVPGNELRRKFFPFVQSQSNTFATTNNLYVDSDNLKIDKKSVNSSEKSQALRTFNISNLD